MLSQPYVCIFLYVCVLISASLGSSVAAATSHLRKHWNISQDQIISSDLCSMYFQLKWHHINLISIDATCNLIFQCMVFSSNWLHRLCKEVYCTYESGARATVDRYLKKAFVMLLNSMDAHQHEGVTVRCLTSLLKYYFNCNMLMLRL